MELHCNICYEDFDLNERYPVVLPCGHTYVCIVCTKSFSPKVCHVCREPLVIYPPRPQQSAVTNHAHAHGRNISRSPVPARYSRYNSRYSPTTPPPNTNRPERVEPIPLPLPKNLVLVEMIEAKQRQERLVAEQKAEKLKKKREKMREKKLKREDLHKPQYSVDSQDIEIDIKGNDSLLDIAIDDEVEETDYDDELSASSSTSLPLGGPELISGYAALSGACGTYAVREPEGLVVLPRDPNRQKYHYTKDHDDEKKEGSQHSNTQFSSIFRDVDGEIKSNNDGDQKPSARREPFSIAEGQKVQVVGVMESNDHSVYQLARNSGFIVASGKQLVKVGGPMENSCKMEGMLKSILEKERAMEKKLKKLKDLSEGLKKGIILEQDKPEEVPVISVPIHRQREEVEPSASSARDGNTAAAVSIQANLGTGQPPKTPTRPTSSYLPRSPRSAGQDSVASVDSTVVNLGMSPRTPSQRTQNIAEDQQGDYVYSPAATCPLPRTNTTSISPNLNQPFLDDDAPSSTGVLRYRVNSEDNESSGLGLAGYLGCGTGLFGERLIESSDSRTRNSINRNSDIFRMSQNALMQQANAERRAAALAAVAAVGTSNLRGVGLLDDRPSGDYSHSPLRRGGSFDNGAGVNFRTGMSGHSGLARTHQNLDHPGSQQPRRRMVMNMSQHRGAAQIRLGPRSTMQRRTSAPPDQLVGCQTIR